MTVTLVETKPDVLKRVEPQSSRVPLEHLDDGRGQLAVRALDKRYFVSEGTDVPDNVIAIWSSCCRTVTVVGYLNPNSPGFEGDRERTPPAFLQTLDRALRGAVASETVWHPPVTSICLFGIGDADLPGARVEWPSSFPPLHKGRGGCPFEATDLSAEVNSAEMGRVEAWVKSLLRRPRSWVGVGEGRYDVKLHPHLPDEVRLESALGGGENLPCSSR